MAPTKAKNSQEQYKLERRKFLARKRPKPILCKRIELREEREKKKHQELQEEGKEKIFFGDLQ